MKLTFLGAAQTVTGSKYLLETGDKTVLVDCGLFQGYKELRLLNWESFPFSPEKIDAVALTHAHLDHSGYLPILVREGFKGPIYSTAATKDLSEIILRDSGRIQEEDANYANRHGYSKHETALPLYTEEEALHVMKQFKIIQLDQHYPLGKMLELHANRAGHILGSSILTFQTPSTTIVFSGDLGRSHDLIMKPPAHIEFADYLVLESTYGDRLHSKTNPLDELGEVIRQTVKRGGTILIPSFAVGRTQTVLYLLHELKKANAIPNIPIYLDSPMAEDATEILLRHCSETHLSKELCAEFCKVAEYIQTREQSKKLDAEAFPKIIISASGMVEGGRILHHIKHYGPDSRNSIVFTGYQAPMTRGDKILRKEKEIKIHGTMVPIHAHIEKLDSLSSHSDYEDTLQWLTGFKHAPKKVFLTHGEEESSFALKQRIEQRFGWNVIIPKFEQEFRL